MQFLFDGNSISWQQFAQLFPKEWGILNNCNLEATFLIEGEQIALVNEVGSPLYVEIEKKLAYHQRFFYKNSKYSQPLAKAIGLKRGAGDLNIIDATGGMLGDTLLMMAMGVRVTTFERHPIVAVLALNALAKIDKENQFYWAEALSNPELIQQADGVFFDPMFQERNDKTAPKKAMQVFRSYVGPDLDAKIVAQQLRTLTKRLVIKRSSKVSPLLEKPSMTYSGKATSYDVYLN